MKLLISIFIAGQLYAGHIVQINYIGLNKSNATYIKKHLIKEYKIPESLIQIHSKVCEDINKDIINLCIDNTGNLNFGQKNSELISSLKIFNRPY